MAGGSVGPDADKTRAGSSESLIGPWFAPGVCALAKERQGVLLGSWCVRAKGSNGPNQETPRLVSLLLHGGIHGPCTWREVVLRSLWTLGTR